MQPDFAKFTELRLEAAKLLLDASLLNVPEHFKTQARSAAALAGCRLHRAYGEAGKDDANALVDDLEHIVRSVADPLLSAVTAHAAENFHNISANVFSDHLADALSDARGELELEAQLISERRRDTIADRRMHAAE